MIKTSLQLLVARALCWGWLSGQWIIYLRWSRSFGWNCLFGSRCGPRWGHLFVWSQTVEVTCSRLLAESCCHVQLSMCWVITAPTIEAHGPVLPGQKGLPGNAWVSIRDQWRDHPVGWLTCVVPYSFLAALFFWVYHSIVGWTEWSNPRHVSSTNRRSCQANHLFRQSRWHCVLWSHCIHSDSHQSLIKENTGELSVSA